MRAARIAQPALPLMILLAPESSLFYQVPPRRPADYAMTVSSYRPGEYYGPDAYLPPFHDGEDAGEFRQHISPRWLRHNGTTHARRRLSLWVTSPSIGHMIISASAMFRILLHARYLMGMMSIYHHLEYRASR